MGAVSTVSAVQTGGDETEAASSRSLRRRWGLTAVDVTAALAGLLLVVAYAPFLVFEGWTVRLAVVVAILPIGVAAAVRLARARDLAALLLMPVTASVLLSSVVSGAPRSALLGFGGRDLSALVLVASVALWALGRSTTDRGRAVLADVFVYAVAAAGLVGLLQTTLQVDSGPLALAAGRPSSFMTNPVYFGAVCAAGLAATVARWPSHSWPRLALPVALCGIGVSLSGSRVALAAALLTMTAWLVVHRSRAAVIAVLAGLSSIVAGVAIDRVWGAGRNAAARLAGAEGGGRTTVWRYGLDAVLDRPLFGNGLGRFRSAVQGRFDREFVLAHARDETTQAWFDAHNVVIGMLVALGIVGTVLLAVWLVAALRPAHGPLLWATIPIGMHWMLQPVSIYTLPLALLLLGTAGSTGVTAWRIAASERRTVVLAGSAGLVLGGWYLAADGLLSRGVETVDADPAEVAAAMYWRDPVANDLVAKIHLVSGEPDGAQRQLEWRHRTAEAEPDRPYWWSSLALAQMRAGQLEAAADSLDRAYELQPNNRRTVQVDLLLAVYSGDEERVAEMLEVSCSFDLPECGLGADEILELFESGRAGDDR